jgi:hypothetical protein
LVNWAWAWNYMYLITLPSRLSHSVRVGVGLYQNPPFLSF